MKILMVLLQTVVLSVIPMAGNSNSLKANQQTSVAVGDIAPDFTLEDQNKSKVTLSAARGKSPVVLVFYRGYW